MGTLALEGSLSRFRIRQGEACLLAYNQLDGTASDAETAVRSCGVRLSAEADGIRATSDSAQLSDRFYELDAIGNHLSLFKKAR